MDVLSIRLDGVHFDGTGDADTWPQITLTPETKIFGGVAMRREQTDRPTGHGQFWSPGFLSGRLITLAGEIYTRSPAEQEEVIGQLEGLLADGGKARMSVQRARGTVWADVARADAADITIDRFGLLARYLISFWAPDPRWYGDAATLGPSASLALRHWGNFPALPRFTVMGSAAANGGYTIASAGRQYVVTDGPAAGETDVIDFATGWLYRNGQLTSGKVSRYETWPVRPGLPQTHTCTVPFSATVTDTFA